MIYVEEKSFDRQLELLVYLSKSEPLMICAWLYPESKVSHLAGLKVSTGESELVAVTSYDNGFRPKHTELVFASSVHISALRDAAVELKDNCDSLALYKENEQSWHAATIGHEGMCLVQSSSLCQELVLAGFSASEKPPSWW